MAKPKVMKLKRSRYIAKAVVIPIVEGGRLLIYMKTSLKMPNCWNKAMIETKTPISIEKSQSFCQSFF